jgi:hypothetical protein
MFHLRRSSLFPPAAFVLLTLALALVFSCSEQLMEVDQEPGGGNGDIEPGIGGSFLLGLVSDSSIAPGHIEVWGMDVEYDSAQGIVSFDVQLVNRSRTSIPPPIHFVITEIVPHDISVVDFDGVTGDGFPFYDFSEKLGDDNVLEPEERSERVRMYFQTGEERSFAIGFRIDLRPPDSEGAIGGVVYRDDNKNGRRDRCDRCEPGIPEISVGLEKPLDNGDRVILITRTNGKGEYRFYGLKEGVYKVFVSPDLENWEVTSANPLLVTLVEEPDGSVQSFLGAHFGLFPMHPPVPDNLFGPIMTGPLSPFGTVLDTVFTNPATYTPVQYNYYLDVMEPPFAFPSCGIVDSASAWINDELVFEYHRIYDPDTAYFAPTTVELPDSLVPYGENRILLTTYGNRDAVLMWRVYREPGI